MIDLLLTRGANPNMALTLCKTASDTPFTYTSEKAWTTVWALFLQSLHDAARAKICKPPELIQDEIEATKLMIEHGAAADLRPRKILASEDFLKIFGSPVLTPWDIFHEVFPPHDAIFLEQLLRNHRPWALRQACSWLKRTVLLWFYRDIDIVEWWLTSLFFFNDTISIALLIVFSPMSLRILSLVWPATWFPVLLPALILSDWIPILDWLVSCLVGVLPRYAYVVTFTGSLLSEWCLQISPISRSVEEAFKDPGRRDPRPYPPY